MLGERGRCRCGRGVKGKGREERHGGGRGRLRDGKGVKGKRDGDRGNGEERKRKVIRGGWRRGKA